MMDNFSTLEYIQSYAMTTPAGSDRCGTEYLGHLGSGRNEPHLLG